MALRLRRHPAGVDVDLRLPPTGVTAFFGPSGSGKTTCLRLLAGLEHGHGRLWVSGTCWQDDERGVFIPVHRRAVGCVFQDHTLLSHLSVAGNLEYGRRRNPGAAMDLDVVVGTLGIEGLLGRRSNQLSGGERQRVAIAQALLRGPRLLLLDEPLSAMDSERKAEIARAIERVRDELAIPIVYVSHALDEVARLADHLVLLAGGRAIASGALGATLARLDLPTAVAEDAGVVIDGRVAEHDEPNQLTRVAFEGGSLWVSHVARPVGAKVRARALARDVSLALDPPGPSSILNVLVARVAEVREGADRVTVRLALEGDRVSILSRVTRRSMMALGLRPGLAVFAMIKTVALFA
jgi:molybdate transport system ATP-binding protein